MAPVTDLDGSDPLLDGLLAPLAVHDARTAAAPEKGVAVVLAGRLAEVGNLPPGGDVVGPDEGVEESHCHTLITAEMQLLSLFEACKLTLGRLFVDALVLLSSLAFPLSFDFSWGKNPKRVPLSLSFFVLLVYLFLCHCRLDLKFLGEKGKTTVLDSLFHTVRVTDD